MKGTCMVTRYISVNDQLYTINWYIYDSLEEAVDHVNERALAMKHIFQDGYHEVYREMVGNMVKELIYQDNGIPGNVYRERLTIDIYT